MRMPFPPSTEPRVIDVQSGSFELLGELLRKNVMRLRTFGDASREASEVLTEVIYGERLEALL